MNSKGKNKRNKKVNNASLVNNKKADNNKKKLNFNELIKKIFSISKRTSLEKLKKFKTLLRKVSEYRIFNIVCILFIVELAVSLLCIVLMNSSFYKTDEQSVYKDFGDDKYAQISLYFSGNNEFTMEDIYEFRELYASKGLSYLDTYSYQTSLEAKTDLGSYNSNVIFVDDKYFDFHPFKLLSGSYINEFDNNKDYILIDEYAAWKLFNSGSEVENLEVKIDEKSYYVKGVYKHIDDDLYEKAGLEKGTIFIPICNVMNNSLSGSEVEENMDDDAVIDSYEVILPNEVRGYAYRVVEALMEQRECDYDMVDYSERYRISSLWDTIINVEDIIINSKGIKYPYYENVTRYYIYAISRYLLVTVICGILMFLELIICIMLMINSVDLNE